MIVVQDSYLRLGYFTRTFDHHRSEVEFLGWVVRWWDGVKSCSCSTAVEAEIVLGVDNIVFLFSYQKLETVAQR